MQVHVVAEAVLGVADWVEETVTGEVSSLWVVRGVIEEEEPVCEINL